MSETHLINSSRTDLQDYLLTQLGHFFPDRRDGAAHRAIQRHLDTALTRTMGSINAVKMWKQGAFHFLHSSQYCIFLYFLANSIWREDKDAEVPTKLFFLNKVLNGIDLFYEIEMPEVFFIGHSVGIVLAKATYGNYLALYQNSTVGKNHGIAPVLGEKVILYPNTAVIGKSRIGDGAALSQGTSAINRDVPAGTMAFQGEKGAIVAKPMKRPLIEDFFRF